MATCYNRNTTEYKALLSVYELPYVVDGVISSYQDANNTDKIPTPQEASQNLEDQKALFSLKTREFKEALIQNLTRNSIASRKVAGGPLLVNNSRQDTREYDEKFLQDNVKKLYGYLSANNIPSETVKLFRTQSGLTYRVEINENLFTAQDILQESRGWDTTKASQVFKHLTRLFPQIQYQYVTPQNAQAYYNSLPASIKANLPKDFKNVNSYYENGRVTMIKGRLTNDTPIEEMLHPFIDAVALDNSELFASLLEESKVNFPILAQQIQDAYTDDRGFNESHRNLELVTQALTRHFRNEFENEPTKSYGDKIMELIKWFVNLINDLHKYLTGSGIPQLRVDMLKPSITLSEVAKLLNTDNIEFKLNIRTDSKVKFSLSDKRKNALANVKKSARSDAQKKLIDKLFFAAGETQLEIDQFAAGMADGINDVVIYDKASGEFVNLTDSEVYSNASDLINDNIKNLRSESSQDIKSIASAIAEGVPFDSIKDGFEKISEENAESVYEELTSYINDLKQWGDVVIPQVVLFDKATGTADIADFLILSLEGQMKIVNISASSYDFINEDQSKYKEEWKLSDNSVLRQKANLETLSAQAQDAVRAGLQKRMLENMGYTVFGLDSAISTYHIQFNQEDGIVSRGYLDYTERTNQPYVDMIIPESKDKTNKFGINNIIKQDEFSEESEVRPEDLDYDFSLEDIDYVYSEQIEKALKSYKVNLENRAKDIKAVKGAITLSKTKEQALERINNEVALITATLAQKDGLASSALVTDILISSIKEVNELVEYLGDEANVGKSEYISIINNARDFLKRWQGFIKGLPVSDEGVVSELTVNQIKLKDKLQSLMNKLTGIEGTEEKGLLVEARLNYVIETIYNTTSQELTKDEIRELLDQATDIVTTDYLARDMSTSRDLPSRILDKLYKRQRLVVNRELKSFSEQNMRLASQVSKLTGGNNAKDIWSWMYETDENGNPTGLYITELGEQYRGRLQELWDGLRDEKGEVMEYRKISDIETANPEDIKFNKMLYAKKRALAEFLSAESIINGEPEKGDFHEYKQEYIDARNEVKEWVRLSKNYGEWQWKAEVTEKQKREFEYKYEEFKTINRAVKENGVFTGKVIQIENVPFAKREYKQPRLDSSSRTGSQNMRSKKYQELISDTSELGRARQAYYNFFKENYEKDFLNRLPVSVRDQQIGSVPMIKDNAASMLFKGEGVGIKAKFLDRLGKTFKTTQRLSRVAFDSNGNPVDTLPIMFTGSPKSQERLDKLEKDLEAKKIELRKKPNSKQIKEDINALKYAIQSERSKPLREEISFDLPATMEAFASMAITYDVMSSMEDLIVSFIDTMRETTYTKKDTIVGKAKNAFGVSSKVKEDSDALKRVLWWKNNVFYGKYKNSKTWVDKFANNLMRYSSLTYVAFNPTGNLNNWVMGRVNNAIEQLGGRFFAAGDLRKAEQELFTQVLPHAILRFAKRTADLSPLTNKYTYDVDKPMSLYEGLVEEFSMMDESADIREFVEGKMKNTKTRLIEFGYSGQDAGEYQLQTTVGHAILRGTYVRNSTSGEILSVRDLYTFDHQNQKVIQKEGFDEVVLYNPKTETFKVTDTFDQNFKDDLRNKIREANKQIHGNYAKEDMMVIEGFMLGRMATQFKKWVMPAIRNRIQDQYYDENLGWIEGRYNSLWRFLGTLKRYAFLGQREEASLKKQFLKESGYDEAKGEFDQINVGAMNSLKNLYRNTADIGLILTTLLVGELLDLMESDEDDTMIMRRLKNLARYQQGRLLREQLVFTPFPKGILQLYETADSPFAVMRVGYELYEAISATATWGYYKGVYSYSGDDADWYGNKDIYYQRGRRRGQLKVAKQWKDVIPALYGFQKIKSLDEEVQYWIGRKG